MSDAYTVGINLALNNSVSEGLASIRPDLGTLNRVIDDSAIGMKRLEKIAKNLKIAPRQDTASTDQPKSPTRAPASTKAQGATRPAPTEFMHMDGNKRPDPSSARYNIVGRLASAPTGSEMPHRSAITSATVPVVSSATALPRSWNTAAGNVGGEASRSPVAPASVLDRVQSWATRSRLAVADLSISPTRPTTIDSAGRESNSVDASQRSRHRMANAVRATESVAVPYPQAPAVSRSPISSRTLLGADLGATGAAAPKNLSTSALFNLPSAVPPPADARASPVQGDVYLDGSRLGKWVVDHLTKSLDRPRTGTTGFDPTLTATWPGAPIGT